MQVNTEQTVTYWGVNNGLLAKLVVLDNRINGVIRATQTVRTLDGNLRSEYVGTRRVTIEDSELIAQLAPLIKDKSEFPVNAFGYWTSSPNKKDKDAPWYQNQVITKLEVLP